MGAVEKMDYSARDIYLHVDSMIEYSVRLKSCGKEPDTVKWLETFLKDGDVLFDVGANVGAYSLVASKFHEGKIKTYAFEPAFINYTQLCKNIFLNNCQESVIPLPLALSDRTRIDKFNYRDLIPGGALHTFGAPVGDDGEIFRPEFTQSVLSFSIDDLIRQFSLPVPNHVKIDVDGIELSVLKGAIGTLANPAVRSLNMEITENDSGKQIIDFLGEQGFQVHSSHARWKKGLANYIFHRNGEPV